MIDNKGNRVPVFVFENIHDSTGAALLELDSSGTVLQRHTIKAIWPGGSTRVPDDNPKCVFDPKPCRGNDQRKTTSQAFDVS